MATAETNRDRLAWLLDFAALTPQEIAQLSVERRTALQLQAYLFPSMLTRGEGGGPSTINLVKLNSRVASALRCWERGEPFKIRLPGLEFSFFPGTAGVHMSGDHETAFLYEAIKLIAAEGQWIRRCASQSCQKFFAARKRARYCSRRCAQREQTAAYRCRQRASRKKSRSAG